MDAIKAEYSEKLQEILKLKNDLNSLSLEKEDERKKFLIDVINAIDIYEMAEEVIKEHQWNNNDNSIKIMNRYSTVLKTLNKILADRGVTKLEYPENRLVVGYCKVVDVAPDPNKVNNTILSVVKHGYIRGKELIREAEVVIVKN